MAWVTALITAAITMAIETPPPTAVLSDAARITAAITTALETPPPTAVLSDAVRAHVFMLTNPVDAVYHGGSG
jgi:hypothetical protein